MLLYHVSRRLICKCQLCLFVLLCWDLNLTSQQAEGLFQTSKVAYWSRSDESEPESEHFLAIPYSHISDWHEMWPAAMEWRAWNRETCPQFMNTTHGERERLWAWRRALSALMMRTVSPIIRVPPVDTPFSLQCLLNHEIRRWIPRYCSRGDLKLDRVMIVQKRRRKDASAFGAMINIQFLLVCSWEERKDKKSSGLALRTADEEHQEEEIRQSSKCPMFVCIIELFIIVNLAWYLTHSRLSYVCGTSKYDHALILLDAAMVIAIRLHSAGSEPATFQWPA